MTEIEVFANELRRSLPHIKDGSLRFWGVWFGRPYDAFHRIISCEDEQALLRFHFDDGELLSAWHPRGLTANKSTFRIIDAERVRWEWFYYGRPPTEGNRRFMEFVKSDSGIVVARSDTSYKLVAEPRISEPAVEIL